MSTKPTQSQRDALRVGVFAHERCIEERIQRPGRPLTIGQTLANDIVLPSSSAPRQHVLFESNQEGRWQVHLAPGMGGRWADKDGLHNVETSSEPRSITLSATARGRIDIGHIRVLFQPTQVADYRRHLPASMGGGVLGGVMGFLGMGWLAALAISGILQLVPLFAVMLSDWPEPETLEALPDWYANTSVEAIEPEKEEEEVEPDVEEGVEGAVAEDIVLAPTPAPPPETTARPRQTTSRDTQSSPASKSTRKARGKKLVGEVFGVDPAEGSMGAALASSIVGDHSALAALEGLDPNDFGPPSKELALNGPEGLDGVVPLNRQPGDGDYINRRHTETEPPPERKKIKFVVTDDTRLPPDLPSKPGKGIERVFTKKRKQIENCYKRTLQKHGSSAGKVVAKITIGTNGEVLKFTVSADTVGHNLARCMEAKITRFKFPTLDKPVTVLKRWVFN